MSTSSSVSQSLWFSDAQAYYPYVKECPGGWQPVAPQTSPSPTPGEIVPRLPVVEVLIASARQAGHPQSSHAERLRGLADPFQQLQVFQRAVVDDQLDEHAAPFDSLAHAAEISGILGSQHAVVHLRAIGPELVAEVQERLGVEGGSTPRGALSQPRSPDADRRGRDAESVRAVLGEGQRRGESERRDGGDEVPSGDLHF